MESVGQGEIKMLVLLPLRQKKIVLRFQTVSGRHQKKLPLAAEAI